MTAPSTRPRVSVVSPFFNEEAIIENALERMIANQKAAFGEDWELILVDDGSRDSSRERVLTMLDERDVPNVVLIGFDVNQGRGRALKAGIDAARAEIIVTTELDCSWGDSIVSRLVAELESHPELDFIIASPHAPGGGLEAVSWHRRFLTRYGNLLIRAFFSSRVTMHTGMTRAYRRACIQPLVVHENEKEFHLEVLLKLITLGFRVGEIPATITWRDRQLARAGSPRRRSSTRVARTIASHLQFVALAEPVRYFAYVALAAGLAGGAFLISAVWALFHDVPAVYLAIIGLLMCLFCLLFAAFAVLFAELRSGMREQWMANYSTPFPPSARLARTLRSAR